MRAKNYYLTLYLRKDFISTCAFFKGNNILHALTKGDNTLRIHMMNFSGTTYDAIYKNFRVGDEESKYNMTYDCFVEVNSSAGKIFNLD